MAAEDNLSQALFHGSLHEFKPGDVISHTSTWEPGKKAGIFGEDLDALHDAGYAAKTHRGERFVYASPNKDYAKEYSEQTVGQSATYGGEVQKGHIYEVEPVQPSEMVHLTPDEVGTTSGFKVKRKI